jgi:lysophospholipase L1-like esterase
MTRRTLVLLAGIVTLIGALVSPTLPAGASHLHSVDPTQLALPASGLPSGTVVVHSAVSDNTDADGAPSPDGYNDDIRQLHPTTYAQLGRASGYRERFHFSLQGTTVTTQYLASIFATPDQAKTALTDATTGLSPIALIGAALSPQCSAGDGCVAYAGVNGTDEIIYTAFRRGPVLAEFASAVDTLSWTQFGTTVQNALYSILSTADTQVQQALGGSGSTTTTPTPTPTATATPTSGGAPIAVPSRTLGSYYLALGDSYAAGYLTEDRPIDTPCKVGDAPGFVCVFWRYLKEITPQLQLDNLGEPGADSCELAGAGHRCYESSPRASSVDAAVEFLKTHPGQVSPITLTIGGNDLLALLSQAVNDPTGALAKLPTIFPRYRSNLDTILGRLRAAAPNATIIVTTQPNPFGGLGSPPLPPALPQLAMSVLKTLDQVMKDETPKYGAIIADSAAAFDAYPGGGSALSYVPQYLPQGKYEIHPTPQGYKVYGEALIAASGYRLPMSAQLQKKQVKTGKSETLAGTTMIGGAVTIQVWTPHRGARTMSTTASDTGSFSQTFKVGKLRGKGAVKACVSDADKHSSCTGKLSFAVR